MHDTILRYTKGDSFKSNKQFQPLAESYVASHYRHRDKNGRVYRTDNVTAGGLSGGGYKYEWNGITKVWRYPQERMQELHEADRLHYTRTGSPEYIRYLLNQREHRFNRYGRTLRRSTLRLKSAWATQPKSQVRS